MAMYYLAQEGKVTGPYAEGRLISMEDRGEIGLLAAAIDRPKWICEKCGNRIEKTSKQCPSCGVPLIGK
jgi:rubrerythrin